MAEEPSTIYLEAGPNQQVRHELGSEDYDQLNNAKGSDGTYINGIGRPSPITGAAMMLADRVFKTPQGDLAVHRGPGEALFISLQGLAAGAIVSANFVIELHEEIVDIATGDRRRETWQISHRNTDVSAGGVAANATLVVGQRVPCLAIPRLGPTEYGRLYGYAKVVTADA